MSLVSLTYLLQYINLGPPARNRLSLTPQSPLQHFHLFLITLGIFIHSTLVYSYHHLVPFPQIEYQLSFSPEFHLCLVL